MVRCLKAALLLALGFAVSCQNGGVGPQTSPFGRFYLETEYVNHAWGHVHRGVFIDTAGVVISYDLAKSGVGWQATANELYTEAELWAKIHHNDTVWGSIPADTLSRLRRLAYASVSGSMSDTLGAGADMGIVSYVCFTLEGTQSLFRRTELRVQGDVEYHNTSTSAVELANWMASRK